MPEESDSAVSMAPLSLTLQYHIPIPVPTQNPNHIRNYEHGSTVDVLEL